ncbi:MAG: cytochrome P450, partial [Novosphingobium sp.]|nr:cytochrome P450 [Novosphingobium sp.]
AVPAHVPGDRVIDLDVYNPAPECDDPVEAWKALHNRDEAVLWTTGNGGHWIATRGSSIAAILNDHESFSSNVLMVPRERGLSNLLPTAADPPRHRPFRMVIQQAFTPASVRAMEQGIRDLSRALIAGIAPKGEADFMKDFASRLPTGVFLQIADLPVEDFDLLYGWMEAVMRPDGSADQADLMQRFSDYLVPILRERKANPGDDVLSAIATADIGGQPITDEDAINMGTTLLLGGLDTVAALMSFVWNHLARDPALQKLLADNPDRIRDAVEEFCRRFPVGTNTRVTARDTEIDGVTIRAGDLVTTPQILHAIDGREYPDPLTFDIDRQTGGYSSFGHGVHRCPGSFLGKVELRVALEEWIAAIPEFGIAPGARVKVTPGVTAGIFSLPLAWAVAN